MAIALLSFVAVFLLFGSVGLFLFYREAMLQRVNAVISPRSHKQNLRETLEQTGSTLTDIVSRFDSVLPKSQQEVSVMQQRLIRAGYRDESTVKLLYGVKIVLPIVLVVCCFVSGLGHWNPFLVYLGAIFLGFLGPDFWLGHLISRRQAKIRRALPDVLDLMVICVEAGLGLDQATTRTVEELGSSHPEICDEMSLVVLEQRAGLPRGDAWTHFAERTDLEMVRSLVAVLVQAEKFGTSIARTLRVHSETLRTQRRQAVEEQAAKTSVKLVFPLVFFIFPSLFVVTLGPAGIAVMAGFSQFLK